MPPHLILLPGLDGTTALLRDFIQAARPAFAAVQAIAYPTRDILDYSELETLARAAPSIATLSAVLLLIFT